MLVRDLACSRVVRFSTLAVSAALASCTSKSADAPGAGSPSALALAERVFATTPPAGARPLAESKQSAKAGDRIVVSARIGGREQPFVDGRAVIVVADTALSMCNEREGDGCPTPWDYCCETPESIVANTATVIVADAAGTPLATSLRGVGGLEPGRAIVVAGTVSENAGGGLVIVAESIHVQGA